MDSAVEGYKKIVLLDDEYVVREVLKKTLHSYKLYTTDNGIEGLGFIYLSNPDLIIIDTTLPKYGGLEVVDYLISNDALRLKNTPIIVIHEYKSPPKLNYANIKYIGKGTKNFLQVLEKSIADLLQDGNTPSFGLNSWLGNALIKVANISDKIQRRIERIKSTKVSDDGYLGQKISRRQLEWTRLPASAFFLWIAWLVIQTYLSVLLTIYTILSGRANHDENLPQLLTDSKNFRVRYYPTLVTATVAVCFLFLQLALFISGGIVIFNTKITSIFANSNEVVVDFSKATFDPELIELVNGELRLKEQFVALKIDDLESESIIQEETLPLQDVREEDLLQPQQKILNEEFSTPEEGNINDDGLGDEVLDDSVLGVSSENISSGYASNNPVIHFNEGIEYVVLKSILEESSLNTTESSVLSVEENDFTNSDTSINYQLSPDNSSWYYFGTQGWEETTQGYVSSTTVQDINLNIDSYVEKLGSGKVFLRAYLHTNGSTGVVLKRLIVNREASGPIAEATEIVDPVSNPVNLLPPVSFSNVVTENMLNIVEELPVPTIFQATYVNGNKIVYGKVLGTEISNEQLEDLKVRVYYTNSTDIKSNASDKVELIGETSLERNISGDLMFFVSTQGVEGGYVAAELVYAVNSSVFYSNLSRPLENSTFTVDSTGDTVDHTLNGVCSAGTETGGVCTLRAAIAEANFVAGADNIYFNIPTTDSGYRDYDDPDTASSGDGVGGDDYWSIRPGTLLPTVYETILIDGATQTTNQGDTNSLGPEIDINGAGQIIKGIVIDGMGAAHSEVNGLGIRSFSTTNLQISNTSGGSVNDSFIGGFDIQARSLMLQSGHNIVVSSVTGIVSIGSTIGNIIGGTSGGGVLASCPVDGSTIVIARNYIGLNKANLPLNLGYSAISINGNCNVVVGGDSEADRNYISSISGNGQRAGVWIGSNHSDQRVVVKNNYFGANREGVAVGTYENGVWVDTESSIVFNNEIVIEHNLFKGGPIYGIRSRGKTRSIKINENSFGPHIVSDIRNLHTYSPVDPSWFSNTVITNNFFGVSESDPYFNVPLTGESVFGIWLNSASPVIKGNIIDKEGIRSAIYADHNSNPSIGGSAYQDGSICEGLEKNCISGGAWNEIYMVDSVPKNESNLFTDNTFPDVRDGANAIEQSWYGLFEIFSGDKRRTDIANGSVNISVPEDMIIKTTNGTEAVLERVLNLTNYNVACTVALNCPVSDGTNGVTSVLGNAVSVFSSELTWLRVTEYIIDKNGVKTEYSTNSNPTHFDVNHLSSREFSFDGNSTNHIPSSDRGQPWTKNLTADRNISTGTFGRFQIMEVEYVDANPILQEDGSYVITVDSTEDIAVGTGTTYSDDGAGTASGGMSKLSTTVLANGKTSLREAIEVANNRVGFDNIYFSIPESDSNYSAPTESIQGYFSISTTGSLTLTDDNGTFINGYSQPGASRNTATFGEEIDTILKIQVKRTGGIGTLFTVQSNNNHITGINGNQPLSVNAISFSIINADNNWIEGNILGANIDGAPLTGNQGVISISNNSNNNIIGTNGDGINDKSERNILMGDGAWNNGKISVQVGSNNVISGNYIGVNKSGRACGTGNTNRQQILVDSGAVNTRIGTNYDGLSDSEESNIVGCVTANQRGLVNILASTGSTIQGNYIGTNPYGDVLSSFEISGINFRDGVSSGNTVQRNVIANNNGAGIRIGMPIGTIATLKENQIFGNTYDIDIVTSGGNFNLDNLTPNDTGDYDTGPNNLMNYPEIQKVTYLSGGKYRIEGILDNNVPEEAPYDIEICISDNHSSGHGGCIETLGYFENEIQQVPGGINPWSVEITIEGDNGTQHHIFSSLATNALGSTSEFSANFNTENNPNFTLATYPITLTEPTNNSELTDRSPILRWNTNGDLDLKHYEIYINGTFYALVPANKTELQIPYELPTGIYSWQVVGVRNNNTESGRSTTNTFKVLDGEIVPVSSPVLEPITALPPVSFIPRDSNDSINEDLGLNIATIVVIALISLGVVSAAAQVIQKYRKNK